jgi:hypothetical protein
MVTRNRGRGVGQAPRQAHLPPVLGRRPTASNLCRSSLRSFKPVSWAALRRLVAPALKARVQSRRRVAGSRPPVAPLQSRLERQAQSLAATWYRLCPLPKVLANPSLEPGPPPASRLARAPASVIIRCAGQAPSRLRPLSSNVRPHKRPMNRFLTILGLAASLVYTVLVYTLVSDRLHTLSAMPLNEVGDFLAGAFGPLALLWLILGYLQQGIELGLNTKALELQVVELRNSVLQQRELVDVARKQFEAELEVLRHERHRAEQAVKPRFIPEAVGGTHHSSGRSGFWLPIRNSGAPISNVSFEFDRPMQSVQPHLLSEWAEDQTVKVLFSFPDWKASDANLTIAYTAGDGHPGEKVFSLKADLSGTHPSLRVVRPDR